MSDREKTIDRLNKLFNRSVENGCTEEEAATALRLALEIMTREGISSDELNKNNKEEYTALMKQNKDINRKSWEIIIVQAAAKLCLVKCIIHTHYSSSKKYPTYTGFTFVGSDEYIAAAEMTNAYIRRQIDYLCKLEEPKTFKDNKAKWHYIFSFKEGCATRVFERVKEMMRVPSKELVESTGSNALVIQNYWEKINKLNNEAAINFFPNLSRLNMHVGGTGFDSGHVAGDKVKLRQEIRAPSTLSLTHRR